MPIGSRWDARGSEGLIIEILSAVSLTMDGWMDG